MTYFHTDREYQANLNMLRDRVVNMAKKVRGMVDEAIRAFVTLDANLVENTVIVEEEVNALEIEIDDLCVSLLAKHQPVASDLRFLVAVLKLVPNLERIADHAVTVAKRAAENLGVDADVKEDIICMGNILLSMIDDFQVAFITGDTALAEKIISRDATIDAHYSEVFRKALKILENNASRTFEMMLIQSVIKNIERIGDHIKNISEFIIYMYGGVDIRHRESLATYKSYIRGVLFLCVHNSARSQIAEAFAKRIFPEGVDVFSAGSDPASSINPYALRTMAEIGIDISSQKPKRISDVPLDKIDVIITLCDEEICVDLPVKRSEKWSLPDPTRFTGSDDDIREKMNSLRDEIKFRIESACRELFK